MRAYEQLWEHDTESARLVVAEVMARAAAAETTYDPALDPMLGAGMGFRSGALDLNSWHNLEPFLIVASEDQDRAALRVAAEHIDSWLARHDDWPDHPTADEGTITYDTAVASRYSRLAFLMQARGAKTQRPWHDQLIRHAVWLADDANFNLRHNHGVISAVAALAGGARFPGLEAVQRCSELMAARLAKLLDELFTSDGVLREHSPRYQFMLGRMLWGLMKAGCAPSGIAARADQIIAASRWMMMPDGTMANLGDTHREGPHSRLAARMLLACEPATPAEPGIFGEVSSKCFGDGGFWFVKGRTEHGACYLAQTAAFHSRVHKQADTCSFIWHDRGRDVIVDAGLYDYAGRTEAGSDLSRQGFWYSDPRRIYVESTRAHSTIELNGNSHVRTARQAYGSSMRGTAQGAGLFASESSIANLPRANHRRVLVVQPGSWVLCLDEVRSKDNVDLEVRQWLQVAPEFLLRSTCDAAAFASPEDGRVLEVVDLLDGTTPETIGRGERQTAADGSQTMLGWWSRARQILEPCTSLAFLKRGPLVRFATLLSLDPVPRGGRDVRINVTGRNWQCNWLNGKTRVSVRISTSTSSEGFAVGR